MASPVLSDQDFLGTARISNLPAPVADEEPVRKIDLEAVTGFVTGDVKFAMRQNPETGWVFATGTIGNASSGATRANVDCEALFLHLWVEFSVTYAPLFTSAGAGTGKGASAAADWAANKRITIPDARGRILLAQDNMGGVSADNVNTSGSGVNATIPGVGAGAQNVTLTAAQSGLPNHTHNVSGSTASNTGTGGVGLRVTALSSPSNTANAPSGGYNASAVHNNMPPVLVLPLFIKL